LRSPPSPPPGPRLSLACHCCAMSMEREKIIAGIGRCSIFTTARHIRMHVQDAGGRGRGYQQLNYRPHNGSFLILRSSLEGRSSEVVGGEVVHSCLPQFLHQEPRSVVCTAITKDVHWEKVRVPGRYSEQRVPYQTLVTSITKGGMNAFFRKISY
jgi:hypothetical protein